MRVGSLLLVMALCLCSAAGSAEAQTGTIAGTVVEDGTATPLFGAGEQEVTVWVFDAQGTLVASGSTDATGAYSIPNRAIGTYFVKVNTAPGHVVELYNNIPCIAADCAPTVGEAVNVTTNATTTVNFSLAKEGTITGTITAAGGGEAPGAKINVYNASTSLVVASVSPAANGVYVVKGLATGTYLARATFDGLATFDFIHELYGGVQCHHLAPASDCRIASGTPINVTAGLATTGIDFSLDKGASISGTIVEDGSGTPISGVSVSAYIGDVLMGFASTGQAGQYSIIGLPAGRVRVRTEAAQTNFVDEWQNGVCLSCPGAPATLTLTAGQALSGIDFSLATGGTITGTLSCAQGTSADFLPAIDAFDSTGRLIRSMTSLGGTPCSPTPRPYTIAGLPIGTYYLLARDTPVLAAFPPPPTRRSGTIVDQLYGGTVCITADCDVRKGIPVTVTAGATTSNINFFLQRGAGLNVSFLNQDPEAILKLYDARGIEIVRAVGTSSGFFRLYPVDGLPPGTYYATLDGRPHGVTCAECPPTDGRPFIVNPDLSITGPPNFGITGFTLPYGIKGIVTNAAGGAPLSTITVEIVSSSGTVAGRATTDLLGRYRVTQLAPGTFFARTVNDRGFVDEVYADAACGTCDARLGTPVVISASGDISGIDFALAAGGIVSGQVTDTVGIALGNVPVSLYGAATTFVGVKTTSGTGLYRATLPAATYTAVAEESTKNGSEIYSEMPCTSGSCDPATGTPIPLTTGIITSNINFTVASCSAMTLSPPLLASGLPGRSYRQVLSVSGGTGPYVFDVTEGALPTGITLNASTGLLEGTPTVAGRSTFRVAALDSNGCANDRSYSLDVYSCAFTLSPSSASFPAAGGNVRVTIANSCGFRDKLTTASWIHIQLIGADEILVTADANTQTTARTSSLTIGRRSFEVRQAGTTARAPFGSLDVPAQNSQAFGTVAVGGWALDDLEVTRVRIFRDSVAGEPAGLVFIGDAVFVPGARPDVQAATPGVPRNDRAGFGYAVLTNTFPNQGNGTFRIHAVAEDTEGRATVLGSRTIFSQNANAQFPFGTIDTPGQGQAIAGSSYVNFGWALTPQPGMIPTDGSTIQVMIDGAPIGTATYNFFRPDVSNTFPGLANSGGPVGYRIFDTTALAEGLHTISWLVTDTRPGTSGLGSRYFVVANSAEAQPSGGGSVTSSETTLEASDVAKPIGAAPAPDLSLRAESIAATSRDARADGRGMTVAPMERIELALDSLLDPIDQSCSATWAGYLVKDRVLSELPVGASLDPAGTFFWQTGPGFAGRFPLVFVRTNCRGEKQQVPVTVTIPIQQQR
jgi:hypothetical protein